MPEIETQTPTRDVANYHTALFKGHQDHERIEAFHEIAAGLGDDDFWFLFRHVMGHARILFPHQSLLRDMLTVDRLNSEDRFSQHDEGTLKTWRERMRRTKKLKIYRGCEGRNLTGWSWTTKREVAEAFARATGSSKAIVSIGYIHPKRIVIVPEVHPTWNEVLVFPENVKFSHTEKVDAPQDNQERAQMRKLAIIGLPAEHQVKRLSHDIFNGTKTADDICGGFEKEAAWLRALGFEKRPAYLETIISKLRESESARLGEADAVPPQAERIEGN